MPGPLSSGAKEILLNHQACKDDHRSISVAPRDGLPCPRSAMEGLSVLLSLLAAVPVSLEGLIDISVQELSNLSG